MNFGLSKTAFHTPTAGSVTTDVMVTTYDWCQVRILRLVIEAIHIGIYLIFLETTIIGLHFAADNISLSSFKFLWWAP